MNYETLCVKIKLKPDSLEKAREAVQKSIHSIDEYHQTLKRMLGRRSETRNVD
jgi:hypothetical protein